jgi:hypothetical protein
MLRPVLEGLMGELVSDSERRAARRFPVQGGAVFYAGESLDSGRRATIENLSSTGALVSIAVERASLRDTSEVYLRLGVDTGRLAARAVRVEHTPRRTMIALAFEGKDAHVRSVVHHAIEHARASAARRPIIVLDENETRRSILVSRLRACGMTTLAPTTPLEAFDQLSRTQLHGCVCLLAPCFGQSIVGLRNVICETFPWAVTNVIGDDVDATLGHALASWGDTDIAQLVRALA